MDDLSGMDWNSSTTAPRPQTTNNSSTPISFPSLRPTPPPGVPISGRSTPSTFSNLNKPISKPSTPANDSFATLLSTNANKGQSSNLTLQERQKQLLAEKARQEEEQRNKLESQYGSHHGTFWDGLGKNGSAASTGTSSPAGGSGLRPKTQGLSGAINKPFVGLNGNVSRAPNRSPENDDVLAAFNSQAPVDASSHFPPSKSPFSDLSGRSTPANTISAPTAANNGGFDFDEDDDPFGLSTVEQKSATPIPQLVSGDDDDILGMLAKPVSEIPRPKPVVEPKRRSPSPPQKQVSNDQGHPQSKAVAELVDMGFPTDKSADALAQTDTGLNVQAAVGILLNQAHEESKQKAKGRPDLPKRTDSTSRDSGRGRRPQNDGRGDSSTPAWMQEDRASSGSRKKDSSTPTAEKDVTQYAQDIGSTLFKSANSLWKTGQKKVQRAVADLQQEPDSSQPKWMRDAQLQEAAASRGKGKAPQPDVTDEAMMLESGAGRPQKPSKQAQTRPTQAPFPEEKQRTQLPSVSAFQDRNQSQQRPPQMSQRPANRPPAKLTRQEMEDMMSADAAANSSRRRRPTPNPAVPSPSQPISRPSSVQSPPIQSKNPFAKSSPSTSVNRSHSSPLPTRPKAPPRQIPSISHAALSTSASYRQRGTEAFKRGDYSAAQIHYTSALQGIPNSHPVAIIIYCNRALTNIKIGEPKVALSDADAALSTIGVSRGESEKIALGGSEGEKEMREFYGKALMRKAEALEHMEKWSEALKIWKEAVEVGVGGAVSIQGRTRCEKAASGGGSKSIARSASLPVRKPPPARPKPTSGLADISGQPGTHQHAAVKKLREANAAAEAADDEKFALTDKVDAILIEWKGTKADNLRALLGSLDKVLWPEAGWKKVGMQDLVMANRVKIIYMKAIAKVHPDKIAQDATTEQRMISASVFSTLNEAWDKFKKDNNL